MSDRSRKERQNARVLSGLGLLGMVLTGCGVHDSAVHTEPNPQYSADPIATMVLGESWHSPSPTPEPWQVSFTPDFVAMTEPAESYTLTFQVADLTGKHLRIEAASWRIDIVDVGDGQFTITTYSCIRCNTPTQGFHSASSFQTPLSSGEVIQVVRDGTLATFVLDGAVADIADGMPGGVGEISFLVRPVTADSSEEFPFEPARLTDISSVSLPSPQ